MVKAIKNIMAKQGKKLQTLKYIADDERKRLQDILLSMLKDIIAVCDKQNIGYTLVGGSALGAVRHKGFIPWDDDLDIGMKRADWEKFKMCFQSMLGDKYALEAPNFENKDSKQLLSKIYLKGTEYVMLEEMNFPYHNCIFIDVFIIDNVSDNVIIRSFDAFVANFIRMAAITIQEYRYPNPLFKSVMTSSISTSIYYYVRKIIGCVLSVIPHKVWCTWFDYFVSRHADSKTTKYLTVATGLKRYKGEIIERNVWFPYSKGRFCDLEVYLPNDVDSYLTSIYGNYMQLPPVNEREIHPVVSLKFPDKLQ